MTPHLQTKPERRTAMSKKLAKAIAADGRAWHKAEKMMRLVNAMVPASLRPSPETVEKAIRESRAKRIAKLMDDAGG